MLARARDAMGRVTDVNRWVVAGHSLGGFLAARFVYEGGTHPAALVLIGTSHPRDFSLAQMPIKVTRVYGTRDTIADQDKVFATRKHLPANTREVRIEGGNHSQFGYCGFQPGDWAATITRDAQQELTRKALVEALEDHQ